jgi:two-component system KDP operon response regulator KdpE
VSRILVVVDEEQSRRALRRALVARGYEVVTAADGEDAIAEVEAAAPDLVVLDLNLPDIDGLEVCERVRSWSQVPILVLRSGNEAARCVLGPGRRLPDEAA